MMWINGMYILLSQAVMSLPVVISYYVIIIIVCFTIKKQNYKDFKKVIIRKTQLLISLYHILPEEN